MVVLASFIKCSLSSLICNAPFQDPWLRTEGVRLERKDLVREGLGRINKIKQALRLRSGKERTEAGLED